MNRSVGLPGGSEQFSVGMSGLVKKPHLDCIVGKLMESKFTQCTAINIQFSILLNTFGLSGLRMVIIQSTA